MFSQMVVSSACGNEDLYMVRHIEIPNERKKTALKHISGAGDMSYQLRIHIFLAEDQNLVSGTHHSLYVSVNSDPKNTMSLVLIDINT